LAGHHASLEPIFREATTGRAVLASSGSSSDDQAETEGGKKTDREFLTHLAARSRGNPGVARAIWRASLQVNSDEDVEAKAQEEAAEDKGYTMWVNPLPKINLPSLPSGSSREEALVLHALLLHNGLSAPLLSELLPLGHETVLQIVHRLRTARLVTDADECWQVVPLGYPAVRAFLDREGFLIDVL